MKVSVQIALLFLVTFFVAAPVLAARPVILFDQAHGERFLPGDQGELGLSRFADIARGAGYDLKASRDPVTAAQLDGVAAVILSGPFMPLDPAEIAALEHFVRGGGRVAVMLHIAPPASELLRRFGVMHTNGVVRESGPVVIAGEPLNFKVTKLESHPLFAGMTHFSLYGGWALAGESPAVQIVATTGEDSWVDLNGNKKLDSGDAVQPFGVVVAVPSGGGDVVVFGDDAIFQNRYLDGENLLLAENLLRFLCH